MKNKKSIIVGCIVAVVILWIGVNLYRKPEIIRWITGTSRSSGKKVMVETSAHSLPQEGTVDIVASEWRGAACIDNNMRITAKILTPGVAWMVRFDHRDDQVYPLYPKEWKTNSMLVITNSFNSQEWRVAAGQSITQAVVAWKFTVDTGYPPK